VGQFWPANMINKFLKSKLKTVSFYVTVAKLF
jgi:hypothetical protein